MTTKVYTSDFFVNNYMILSLDTVLAHKTCLHYFRVHGQKNHSEENILCYRSIIEFMKLSTSEQLLEKAGEIYETYFTSKSHHEVTFSTHVKAEVKSRIDSGDVGQDVFFHSLESIYKVMKTDMWKRFLSSSEYQQMVSALLAVFLLPSCLGTEPDSPSEDDSQWRGNDEAELKIPFKLFMKNPLTRQLFQNYMASNVFLEKELLYLSFFDSAEEFRRNSGRREASRVSSKFASLDFLTPEQKEAMDSRVKDLDSAAVDDAEDKILKILEDTYLRFKETIRYKNLLVDIGKVQKSELFSKHQLLVACYYSRKRPNKDLEHSFLSVSRTPPPSDMIDISPTLKTRDMDGEKQGTASEKPMRNVLQATERLKDPGARYLTRKKSESKMVAPPVSLQEFLKDAQGREMFLQFCKKEHTEEGVLFWQAIFEFSRKKNGDERKTLAALIYNKYVKLGSPYFVMVDSVVKSNIESALNLKAPPVTLFNECSEPALEHMKGPYNRFVRSDSYQDYLNQKQQKQAASGCGCVIS